VIFSALVRVSLVAVLLPAIAIAMATQARDYRPGGDSAATTSPDEVTLYIPAFHSDSPDLGLSVATVLNLQVWQTLRKSPWPNPDKLSFGAGKVLWDHRPLPSANFETAERFAAGIGTPAPQLVLWGKCYRYGEGVVAQAYLSLPENREAHPERWVVVLPDSSGESLIEADIPNRRYAFEPILLTSKVVETYSRPDSLRLYADRQGVSERGPIGNEFRALRHEGPKEVEVRSGGLTGWLLLPDLARERSEVTDFSGGVIRAYRGDWAGVRSLMKKVTDNVRTPTQLRIDAHLYRAMAAVKLGRNPEPDLAAAEAINASARRVVIYRAMALLSAYATQSAQGRSSIIDRVDHLVAIRHYVFLPGDPWLAQWRTAQSRLRADI
jgi:hypothetical protein